MLGGPIVRSALSHTILGLRFWDISSVVETAMEEKMDNEMETGMIEGLRGVVSRGKPELDQSWRIEEIGGQEPGNYC